MSASLAAAGKTRNDALPPALLVAGPTGAGKSTLALALAREFGGTVVNADSMQVYRELRVLTARPTEAEEALVPHRLYGVRPAADPANAAWWREEAAGALRQVAAEGRVPILCGGTGLYLQTLARGVAAIPDPGEAARAEARALLAAHGAPSLHARLKAHDPETAAALRPSDAQRLARAWEIWRGTGRGLAEWWRAAGQAADPPGATWPTFRIRLDPPRAWLRAAIAARAERMVQNGVLTEVEALLGLRLPPDLPAMRAHGVREFGAFLAGQTTLAAAVERTARVTAQYAKRQDTWLRHRWPGIDADLLLSEPVVEAGAAVAAAAAAGFLERARA